MIRVHRMFRVHLLDEEESVVCRGTLTWMTGEGDGLIWVPDGGVKEHIDYDVRIELDYNAPKDRTATKGETIRSGRRVWRIYNELPVTAPTVHMNIVGAREPVAAVSPSQVVINPEEKS